MKKYFLLLGVFTFLGCQPALRLATGIKKPKVESYNSIKEYISEKNLPIEIDRNYFLSKNSDYNALAKLREESFRLPDVYLFNTKGQFIDENDNCTALRIELKNSTDENYYDKIISTDSLISNNKTIMQLESILIDSNGRKVQFDKDKNIAVVLWSKFLGNKNQKFLNGANKQLQMSSYSMDIYYLNIDLLESWEE